jgi:hypothetical protein
VCFFSTVSTVIEMNCLKTPTNVVTLALGYDLNDNTIMKI